MSEVIFAETRLSRWQQVSAWPVIALSFAYIGVYIGPIYWYPLHPGLVSGCNIAEYSIWAVFIIDYVVQFSLATDSVSSSRRSG